jgi:homoserine O-acetyltransferase
VAVLGGISATRHVVETADGRPGWWASHFGPGRAVDTNHVRVLGIDFLGGNGGTTGPRDADEASFPDVDTHDQARVLAALLDVLNVPSLHAFVGASYGGMVALAFGELFPARVEQLVVISAAHKSAPLGTAWRTIQRQIIALGTAAGRPEEGLALARALAMTTYRTPDEFSVRFDGLRRPTGDADAFPVWDYLQARGAEYVTRMDPQAFTTLSRSIDLHAVEPEKIFVPTTVVSVRQDQCVPPGLSDELAQRTAGPCDLVRLESLYGHDAFLKEDAFFTQLLQARIPLPLLS